jgi:hypothetical protein
MSKRSNPTENQDAPLPQELKWIENISHWMDDKFRIPGTSIRFGLDPIIGLIPGVGDGTSFMVSAFMILSMVRNGVSGQLAMKMIGNVVFDSLLGTIPFIGDLIDFGQKANTRNLKLLKEHQTTGANNGSGIGTLIGIALLLISLFIGLLYLVAKVASFSWETIVG